VRHIDLKANRVKQDDDSVVATARWVTCNSSSCSCIFGSCC